MAKLQLFARPGLIERVSMTQLRPHLREVVAVVGNHGTKFLITHHGKQVAALVSVKDFWRIWEDEDLEKFGPRHPRTGTRPGGQWVAATGWKKGMAVEWIGDNPVIVKGEVMAVELDEDGAAEAKAEGAKTEKPAPGRKRWWRWW